MKRIFGSRRFLAVHGFVLLLLAGWLCLSPGSPESAAAPPWRLGGGWFPGWAFEGRDDQHGPTALAGTTYNFPRRGWSPLGSCAEDQTYPNFEGGRFWTRSPEQEKVVVAGLYNRYCIRCHGVDGRGVWDIPGVPDFTNVRWQATRSDDQIARIVIEGRGAVMPTFRGSLSLEEAFGMARYLRTFVPGTEVSRPDLRPDPKTPIPK